MPPFCRVRPTGGAACAPGAPRPVSARQAQVAEKPPSTKIAWPVTYALAALARKTATPSKSAGRPLRPIMVRAASAAERAGSEATGAVIGVATNPGTTALQHTPERDHSSACDLVSDIRPPLDAP